MEKAKLHNDRLEGAGMVSGRVAIVILNWNGWLDTIECLESLYQMTYPTFDVIVVDNGSTDESVLKLKEYCAGSLKVESRYLNYSGSNKPIRMEEVIYSSGEFIAVQCPNDKSLISDRQTLIIVKNNNNDGFARGCNIGIDYAVVGLRPEFILLLNNDTVVLPTLLEGLVNALASCRELAAVSPRVLYYDFNGQENVINSTGARVVRWLGTTRNFCVGRASERCRQDEIAPVEIISGACMLVKVSVLNEVGLLDPEYFLGWEETDWCVRASRYNYKVAVVTGVPIWHKEAASTKKIKAYWWYYWMQNRIVFMAKHGNWLQKVTFVFYYCFFEMWYTLIRYQRNVDAFNRSVRGFLHGLPKLRR